MQGIHLFVFSYNRGQFLENCIRSIEHCAPTLPLTIIDDNSKDVYTKKVLENFSSKYDVIRFHESVMEMKTGGLYGCMNNVMNIAKGRGLKYALFIQDDMQFVRPLTSTDLDLATKYFEINDNSIQISATFQRSLDIPKNEKQFYIDISGSAYISKKKFEGGKSNFAATGIFEVERFFKLFKKFELGEGLNSEKARKKGLVAGRSIYPFMCWLPYPTSYRGKRKNLKHRFFEYFGKAGYYPIQIMNQGDVAKFIDRNPNEYPSMEKYLNSPSAPRHDVWSTGGGEYNFLTINSWLARLFRFLKKIKHVCTSRKA